MSRRGTKCLCVSTGTKWLHLSGGTKSLEEEKGKKKEHGRIVPTVEQWSPKPKVKGSNPFSPEKKKSKSAFGTSLSRDYLKQASSPSSARSTLGPDASNLLPSVAP